jgi:hypothetical protein
LNHLQYTRKVIINQGKYSIYDGKNFSAINRAIIGGVTAGLVVDNDDHPLFALDSSQDQINRILNLASVYQNVPEYPPALLGG